MRKYWIKKALASLYRLIFWYYIGVGYGGNAQNDIYCKGAWLAESPRTVFTNGFRNFTLCSGLLRNSLTFWDTKIQEHALSHTYSCNTLYRFGFQGQPPFISYNDPSPFAVTYIGFLTPYPTYLYFPEGLVDPYFPTSLETRSKINL